MCRSYTLPTVRFEMRFIWFRLIEMQISRNVSIVLWVFSKQIRIKLKMLYSCHLVVLYSVLYIMQLQSNGLLRSNEHCCQRYSVGRDCCCCLYSSRGTGTLLHNENTYHYHSLYSSVGSVLQSTATCKRAEDELYTTTADRDLVITSSATPA